VTNTPPAEVLSNDLIKEFANRCTSASRSMQLYMTAENPGPDNETMENLIDTNERLQAALSLHQRAILNARKQIGDLATESPTENNAVPGLNVPSNHVSEGSSSRRPSPNPAVDYEEDYEPPSAPPRKANGKGKERELDNAVAGPSRGHTPAPPEEDPFRDPKPEASHDHEGPGGQHNADVDDGSRLAYEPYHPGFKATPSYVQRQDSAIDKEAMHGAVPSASEAQKQPSRQLAQQEDDDEDIYDAPPKNKGPMYRY
jgi:hypothetical protein